MGLDRDAKSELEAFRSDVHMEVKEMNAAAIRHVEKIVAPFTDVPQRLGAVEGETKKQTPMLEGLQKEAGFSKKARIAAKKERIKRSAIDEQWRRNRKILLGILSVLVAVGEVYHAFFAK